MLKPDKWIREMALKHKMIEPFVDHQVRDGNISYGLSSYGYDMRLADEFKIYEQNEQSGLDPKKFDHGLFRDFKGKMCEIPPNSFVLGRSVEYFRIPRKILALCFGKSTYARCGVVTNITPLEPCYDEATEIMTLDGWKKFSNLDQNEKVATLNKEGELEYQQIVKLHKYRYAGKLISIRGRNIDLAVTPAHLLLVRKKWRKHFELIPAEKIYGKYNYELKRDVIWNCEKREFFTLPAVGRRQALKIPINDWLKFFGLWLAEGSCYYGEKKRMHVIKIAALDKFKKKVIAEALKKLPFHIIPDDRGFMILNKQLYRYLSQFGHAQDKFIPTEIKSLPPKQLEILLDALMLGDGNLETLTYHTASKRLADDVQELILKIGWAAIVRRIPKEKANIMHRKLYGHVIKHNFDSYKVRVSKRHLTPKIYKRSFSTMDYNGFVHDVSVPNHVIYVRRNGKPCWSSNCWEGYVTIEISNVGPKPVKLHANEGIAQVIFLESDEECLSSYKDKKGVYQAQREITLPKVMRRI